MKDEELFSLSGGMIMPHVVSPEVTGGDVITPPIIPKPQGDVPSLFDRALMRQEREEVLERQFQDRIEIYYAKAAAAVKGRRISVRRIQRLLGIGYRHACRIHDMLSERGVIGAN